jgi:surface polysaccharide O-acyltransferase-like enzyme
MKLSIDMPERKERLVGIDIIKVLACFFVVVLHSCPAETTVNYSSILYHMGVIAIPLFFTANGYLFFGKTKTNPFYTYKKRDNILLLVLLWNILFVGVQILLEHKIRNPLSLMVNNLFFQNGFFFQFWYFGALLIIYMLFPVLDRYYNNNRSLFVKISLFFIFLQVVTDGLNIFFSIKYNVVFQSFIPQTFRLEGHISYFLIGGLIKLYFDKIQRYINLAVVIILYIIVLFYTMYNLKYIYPASICEYFYDNFFVIALCISIFVYCLKVKYKGGRIISVISEKLILLIYILHPVVNSIVGNYIDQIWLKLIITLVVTALLSLVITKIPYTEKLRKI